jgi:hypothetical protein
MTMVLVVRPMADTPLLQWDDKQHIKLIQKDLTHCKCKDVVLLAMLTVLLTPSSKLQLQHRETKGNKIANTRENGLTSHDKEPK